MPYLPGFTNDIFISFSHVDNTRGWVEDFQNQLNSRLIQIGARVTIWRDHKLSGADVFSDEIFAQLRHSALLISIVSPSATESSWCEDERQAFEHFADLNGGFRFGNSLRAIKVVKTPLPDDQHRDTTVVCYEFYKRDDQSHRFREFEQANGEFKEILDLLAQDIKKVLDAFNAYRKTLANKDRVYVATTTPDLEWNRNAIVQQLNDWGYAVLPKTSNPLRRFASFQAVANAELDASIFSVHLINDQRRPIDEGGQDANAEQYRFAHELRKDRIVWVEPSRQIYSEFEDALKHGLQKGVEILKNQNLQDLKDLIEERLIQRQHHVSKQRARRLRLYLIYDRADDPALQDSKGQQALRLQEYLEKNGMVVMTSPFTDISWDDLAKDHRDELRLSQGVLLYWGRASEIWFRKVRRLIVTEEIRREKMTKSTPLTKAFYFSSPPTKKSKYRNLPDFVFEQYKDFEPDAMKPLLDRLLADEKGDDVPRI